MSGAVITAPVELQLKPKAGGQIDSVTELTWCLAPGAAEELKRQEITNAQLLVIILDGVGREMSRDVFPLLDLKGWLQFHRPGDNLVLATVVYHRDKEPREIRKILLDKSVGWVFGRTISHAYLRELGLRRLDGQGELQVVVPEAMFAKEPPAWMRWYVSFIYEDFLDKNGLTFKDECDFRRKFLKAVFPFGLLLILALALGFILGAVRTIAALAVVIWLNLAGKRQINYRSLLKPAQNIHEVWASTTSSIWVTKKNGQRRLPVFWVVNPPVAMILTAVTWAASRIFGEGWWTIVSFLLPVLLGVPLGLLAGSLVGMLAERSGARHNPEGRRLQKQQVKQEQRRREFNEKIDALVCAGKEPEVKALSPKPTRVVVLKYYGLKARVCKPFAH